MKLNVTWKNNAALAPQRVYHVDPSTFAKRKLADVAAGLDEVEIDLATIPGDQVTFPAIITVVAVDGSTESAPLASTQYLFDIELTAPFEMNEALNFLIALRPAQLPTPVLKSTAQADALFIPGFAHILHNGVLFQIAGGVVTCFDPKTLAVVATPPALAASLPGKDVVPFITPEGRLLFLGDGWSNSGNVWEWKEGALVDVDLPTERNTVTYRYSFFGNDGKIYRLGGSQTIENGKLLYNVFDPATDTSTSYQDSTIAWSGDGTDLKGSIDYSGIIMVADTTYHKAIYINTNTGVVTAADFDAGIMLGSTSARSAIGHRNNILFASTAKELKIVNFDLTTGAANGISPLLTWADEGLVTCASMVNSGEVAFGTEKGEVMLVDVVTASKRTIVMPDARWIESIFRVDGGFTVKTALNVYHYAFDGLQHKFDAGFDQTQLGATNFHNNM